MTIIVVIIHVCIYIRKDVRDAGLDGRRGEDRVRADQ